ncbi:DJ-1/PfpI family protein [Draconibacterium sp. IB214405]|uniref:DJ-1/PfpI family protein n=1 Tax=Draconibacterium sp. IB214405 TaxID=3097352 RepID=UPI002A1293AC|nr:DJ-1/PfpI family protein [Draconibacterium sp. IB214405]MDX8338270.1 DJ-1/PfpI family protein [Draconibacterium sp. IB214405]
MKKVLLLLANGFEFFEASVFIDVIGWNLEEGDNTTKLYTCGATKEIKSAFNHCLIADLLIDEVDVNEFDALAIPGGFEVYGFYNDAYSDKFLELIREFSAKDKIIASICAGALPLGKSGVLKGKNGTTYRRADRREELKSFGVNVLDQPIVADDKLITSWNPATAANVAFMLLELLTDKENTDKVRKLMGF